MLSKLEHCDRAPFKIDRKGQFCTQEYDIFRLHRHISVYTTVKELSVFNFNDKHVAIKFQSIVII